MCRHQIVITSHEVYLKHLYRTLKVHTLGDKSKSFPYSVINFLWLFQFVKTSKLKLIIVYIKFMYKYIFYTFIIYIYKFLIY